MILNSRVTVLEERMRGNINVSFFAKFRKMAWEYFLDVKSRLESIARIGSLKKMILGSYVAVEAENQRFFADLAT